MAITIKPMKLVIFREGNTWGKRVTNLDGELVFEQKGIILFEEQINKEYFDGWEAQLRGIPVWNIVEVERFI
jgi:hypothetical protein